MLLSRPLIAAYRTAAFAPVRRYLLREFADPLLHADTEETLAEIQSARDVSLVDVPERLQAEIALREQLLRLRLVSGDVQRRTGGGLWTSVARRAQVEWQRTPLPGSALARACGKLLGPTALELVKAATAATRARSLATLGEMGSTVGLATLADELAQGPMPAAAAVGLSRMGTAEAAMAVMKAAQARGLDRAGPIIGVAVHELAYAPVIPLLERMLDHPNPEVQEQAAWALESYPADVAQLMAERVKREADPFVRLNVVRSLGRLGVPGGVASISRLITREDSDLLQLTLIRAAGHSTDPAARAYLEGVLREGTEQHRAEAIQSLIVAGVPGEDHRVQAEAAAGSTHERLALNGMLALVVWDPESAYRIIKAVFDEPPSGRWYCATYALRYLRAPGVVRVLRRVREASAGMDLEEIAVDALARHLDEEGIIDHVADILRKRPAPPVVRCVAREVAHHLPAGKAMEAGFVIRQLISSQFDATTHGPLLETLGALGGEGDLELLLKHSTGPAGVAAVRGIELLANEASVPHLEHLLGHATPDIREAALLAVFRLGGASAMAHLHRLIASSGLQEGGAVALSEMAISVRCTRDTARLALLHGELSRLLAALPVETAPEPDAPPLSDPGRKPPPDLATTLESQAASTPRPTARPDPASRAVDLRRLPRTGSGESLYRTMAAHLGLVRRGSSGVAWWIAGCVALVLAGLAWYLTSTR